MKREERIEFRKLLKRNGFKKSDTTENRKLMEFVKDMPNHPLEFIIVYMYEDVDAHFGIMHNEIIRSIEQFKEVYFEQVRENLK